MFQKEDIAIDVACNLVKSLTTQIRDCIDKIVNEVLEEAKTSANILNISFSFKDIRKRQFKRYFDEKCLGDGSEISEDKKFRLVINHVIDRIVSKLERRFKSIQDVNELIVWIFIL